MTLDWPQEPKMWELKVARCCSNKGKEAASAWAKAWPTSPMSFVLKQDIWATLLKKELPLVTCCKAWKAAQSALNSWMQNCLSEASGLHMRASRPGHQSVCQVMLLTLSLSRPKATFMATWAKWSSAATLGSPSCMPGCTVEKAVSKPM
eukprot:2838985-Lingulodinium_polyedra.AAC.1